MPKRYYTHNVYLESADFHILVVEFPEEDVNDKLAQLATERGLIYRHFYEDFIVGMCMANAGPFFFHIRKRPELLVKFSDIRKEALSLVYQYSPAFHPDNIVINENNVLKTKGSVSPTETVRPLTGNDLWNQDPPLSNFGPGTITSPPQKDDNPFRDDEDPLGQGEDDDEGLTPENPFAGSPGNDNLGVQYELVGHKWDKIGLYINVRKYEESEEALLSLLGGTPFETTRGYHLLITERCIEDWEDVFAILDQMGVAKKINPQVLMEELYNIAISYNPFLKLEDVDLTSIRKQYKTEQKSKQRNNRRMAAGQEDRLLPGNKKKRFKNVPKEVLLNLGKSMREQVVGQDEAVGTIVDAVQRASVGLKREHEPLGTFLFTGVTGVGKTQTAKALADCLGANLVRIDCSEYQQPHEAAKLTGSPPGYVGYDDGGHLVKSVEKHPFSVVLFDEIEKAHSTFHERILQVIDDGVLTDNKGKKVSFEDSLLIMTSNIGVKEVDSLRRQVGFGDSHAEDHHKATKARKGALKAKFKPEFLNRIDEIVNFRSLERDDFVRILDILLDEVKEQISESKGVLLSFSAGAKNFILDNGIDKKFGARPMRRSVKRHLNTPLARAILAGEIEEGSRVTVNLKTEKDGLSFRVIKKPTKKVEE